MVGTGWRWLCKVHTLSKFLEFTPHDINIQNSKLLAHPTEKWIKVKTMENESPSLDRKITLLLQDFISL